MRMRLFIILAVAAAVLLVGEQCEATAWLWSGPGGNHQLVDLAYNVCHDKLVEWTEAAGGGVSTTASSSSDRINGSHSGAFVRGRWKFFTNDSLSTTIHPSFLNSSQGKFDFSSPDMSGLTEEWKTHVVQNIRGHIYFWDQIHGKISRGVALAVAGVHHSYSGEVCLVACERTRYQSLSPASTQDSQNRTVPAGHKVMPTTFTFNDEDCGMRSLLTISSKKKGGRKTVEGTLESLRNSTQSRYFTKIEMDGKMVDREDQRKLYRWDLFTKSTFFAVEAVIIMWQIFHSIRSPSSYFVSMLMILVQIVVMCFLAVYLIAIPWRLLTAKRFKFLVSGLNALPLLGLTVVVFLNIVFFLLILRKRRVAKRLNVVERPQEVLLAIICMVIYAIAAVALWSTHNFESYLQVVWCWFLLPQVVANVFWDLRLKPLHSVYVVGVSLCRVTYIGFNSARPTIYGFDDFVDFPHGWYWGITGTVFFFGSYTFLQQRYGGRCFLPQRLFGYKQLPTSKAEAHHAQSVAKDEDTMLDL